MSARTEFFVDRLRDVPIIAILRGMRPQEAVEAARSAWHAGVPLVEVTLERRQGVDSLRAVLEAAPPGVPVGAGTVTTPERLELALQAGARFAIAPGLDDDTVHAAQQHDVPFLPGIATPTEAGHAIRLGVTTAKLFPAAALGASWIRALTDPFPELRLIATGGVDADNAPGLLAAGAVAVGMGSSLRRGDSGGVVAAVRESRRDPAS